MGLIPQSQLEQSVGPVLFARDRQAQGWSDDRHHPAARSARPEEDERLHDSAIDCEGACRPARSVGAAGAGSTFATAFAKRGSQLLKAAYFEIAARSVEDRKTTSPKTSSRRTRTKDRVLPDGPAHRAGATTSWGIGLRSLLPLAGRGVGAGRIQASFRLARRSSAYTNSPSPACRVKTCCTS